MDKLTVDRYQDDSSTFISRYQEFKPTRIYDLINTFFHRGGKTLDLGCASGRDLAYLSGAGFKMEGLDAVQGFVDHCKKEFPNIPIHFDSLPKLEKLEDDSEYENILLSAVLMHLSAPELIEAVANILRVSAHGARVLVSIRNVREELKEDQEREKDGRLFHNIPVGKLISLFEGFGAKLLFHEEQKDHEREGVSWNNFVFEKIKLKE